MNPPTTQRLPDFREETYGRRLESMRWHHGKLQMGFVEKFSQYEGRRLVTTGERTVWEDVPGDPPAALAGRFKSPPVLDPGLVVNPPYPIDDFTQTTAPPSASDGSGC